MAVLSQALDGSDLFAGDTFDARNARPHGRPVDEQGAGSALSFAATVLAASEVEIVAQDPKELTVRMDFEPVMFAVDNEFHTLILRSWRNGREKIGRE